jgi:hypothetical protein
MSVSYECPACSSKLKSPNPIPAGKSIKCPKCGATFTPEPAAGTPAGAGPGTLKFADDDDGPRKAARPAQSVAAKSAASQPAASRSAAAKHAPAKPPETNKQDAAPAPRKSPFADDDDESDESIKKGYSVLYETEAEKEEADKNKPNFLEVQDKFKRSARGPAMSLLVMPSNLLIGEGLLTVIAAIYIFIAGMWPLVFNDAPPGEEELEEALMQMVLGVVVFFWGAMVCFGASQMQELTSYPWSMVGAIMGILPLLVGIYAIVMLQNPKVKAGFEETEGGPDDDDEDDDDEDDE